MDTQLLRAFIAVTRTQSFSAAAEALHLTQSAISKRIALLEQQLSLSLFDRIGRNIYLTESGKTLLPRALAIIEHIEDTERFMAQQNSRIEGELRIATSHHIGIHRLPSILKAYRQQYPDVHLQLHFIDSEHAIHTVMQDDCDIAITTLPATLLNSDDGSSHIQYHPLWKDPMQMVVGQQHPLQKKKTVNLADLSQHPAILPDLETRTTQLVQALFSTSKKPLTISMTSNHLDAIKMMVAVGLGWSALPESLIDDSLHILPIKNGRIVRELGCIHHRHRTLSNAARAMLSCLKKTANTESS
jgi:DNA-binding transcriptional LysR family regulator